jgi:cellobiose phosphorylase
VHYLSPRGLEQYSGGGWGTRDVCQGPVEMLLAHGRLQPIRDILLRVMRQQNPDGDWPQWFMFFERERGIRPAIHTATSCSGRSSCSLNILIATASAACSMSRCRSSIARRDAVRARDPVATRAAALTLIKNRVIPGTSLAAYGHGDWNDSLQPADPVMRERLCSAWTVTLHVQSAHDARASPARDRARQGCDAARSVAEEVKRDFQRLLVSGRCAHRLRAVRGWRRVRYLLHPSDTTTGVHYSSLAMIHAIMEDMLTPAQMREHCASSTSTLSGPDGVRLFDLSDDVSRRSAKNCFRRAETATFFGREIG